MTVAAEWPAESAAEAGGTHPRGTIDVAVPSRRLAATSPLTVLLRQDDARLTDRGCCLMDACIVVSSTTALVRCHGFDISIT
jgi:hypothetical protein